MTLRFLVVEGNKRADRARHQETFGMIPSESYSATLATVMPGARCEIAFPADEGANLPDAAGLDGYDAMVLTGSALHAYQVEPAITRQIELVRTAFKARLPVFGSCWGIQMGALAAGGAVLANPSGREIGFARRIVRTAAGQDHPLLAGRPAAWDAPAIHLDAVTAVPSGATVLAHNGMTSVQAMEWREDGAVFWGVQYHPEFSLREVATIMGRMGAVMQEEGFVHSPEDHARFIRELLILDEDRSRTDIAWRHGLDAEVIDDARRTVEIRNFVETIAIPRAAARGRG